MIQGQYFPAGSSQKTDARLSWQADGSVQLDNPAVTVNFTELDISSRIGNTPRYIRFPDGAQFETLDNNAIDRMVNALGNDPLHGLAHKLESHKQFVVFTIIAVVLFVVLFVKVGIPAMSKQVANWLPEEASSYMGKGILDAMDKSWFSPSTLSQQRQQQLQNLFARLQQQIPGSEHYQLVFRNGGAIGANAFALPDGHIVFTDELIQLVGDDREVMAVMLHEMGHLKHHHSLRATIQKFSLAMLLMVISGDVSTSSSIISAIPIMLVESGYSRDMETEADEYALQYLQQHGISSEYFARILEKLVATHMPEYETCLQDKDGKTATSPEQCLQLAVEQFRQQADSDNDGGMTEYFASHPASMQRIRHFRQPDIEEQKN